MYRDRAREDQEAAERKPLDEAIADLAWLRLNGALPGVAEIIRERRRQVQDGWTPEHDDQHVRGELMSMARSRILRGAQAVYNGGGYPEQESALRASGALLAAEIDRLNRLLAATPCTEDSTDDDDKSCWGQG
jgi:hypothetical protein